MRSCRYIGLVVACFFYSSVLTAQEDSVMYAKDSVIALPADPTISYFQSGEKLADPGKVIVVTAAKKTMTLASLLSNSKLTSAEHVVADLDDDGKKELLVLNFTDGSAGWEDEIWVYRQTGPNKFQYTAKLLGGLTVLTPEEDFVFSLKGPFEKFFTCLPCNFKDTSDAAPIPLREISVRYNKGKWLLPKGDQELRSIIQHNLGKLGENIPAVDPNGHDDGTRKEIAFNLAVFYYSFGKNLTATKALFTKYYKASDALKVWLAFSKKLQLIGTRVSF